MTAALIERPASEFWCNPREGEFSVSVHITATINEAVKAASKDEARAKVEARLDEGEVDVYGSDIDEARIDFVRAEQPMYLVHRPGTTVSGTSRIQPGDEPREPKDDYERRTYTRPPTTTANSVGIDAVDAPILSPETNEQTPVTQKGGL